MVTHTVARLDEAILYTMDELDKALDKEDIKMVSVNNEGVEKDYGLSGLPLLIHFNGNIPRVFDGMSRFIVITFYFSLQETLEMKKNFKSSFLRVSLRVT